MKKKIFGTWRLALAASAILFALQTAAQSVVTYHSKDVEESKEYIKGNEYQKDFLLFMDMLQSTHPAFEKNAPLDMKKELKQGYARFGKCQNPQSFAVAMQQIAAKIHDGHTAVYYLDVEKLMFPFHFYADGKGFYLDNVQKGLEPCLGKQIVKINGKEMSEICYRFRQFYSTNNEAGFRSLFQDRACYFSPWYEMGLCERDSTLNFTFSDNSTLKLYPVPATFRQFSPIQRTLSPVEEMRQRAGKMPFSYQMLDGGICYLLFELCQDGTSMKSPSSLMTIPVFTDFLETMFKDMKERNVKTLVVDVRANSGGNSILCNQLLAKLTTRVKLQGSHLRYSQLAADYYQAIGQDLTTKNTTDTLFNQFPGEEVPFDGKVIWIQGKRTFSSAGMLMTMAVDNNIGTVIGEPASYTPTHYGYVIGWSLPNTHIAGSISHVHYFRPDVTKGDDISLEKTFTTSFEDYVKGIDPCYEWVKANYSR